MSRRINYRRNLLPLFLLIGFSTLYSPSNALRCFTCGPLNNGYQATCEQFQTNPSTFANDCPTNYNSCSISYKGPNTTRQCEKLSKINDCKIANSVKYCFCSWDLCNGEKTDTPPLFSDDEDVLSDSGSGFDDADTNGNERHLDVDENVKKSNVSASGASKSNVFVIISSTILLHVLFSVLTSI